jgi:hypothetical protein
MLEFTDTATHALIRGISNAGVLGIHETEEGEPKSARDSNKLSSIG